MVLNGLAERCFSYADMEYGFLYDKSQHLLAIGYSVDDRHRDQSYYDLLASEARLTAFVAIAQGKIPEESWFALGRRLTTTSSTSVLLSWSGSMFEYLMPLLVMPNYENTLLDETYKWVNLPHWQTVGRADAAFLTAEQKLANPLLAKFWSVTPAIYSSRLAALRLDRQLDALQCVEAIRLHARAGAQERPHHHSRPSDAHDWHWLRHRRPGGRRVEEGWHPRLLLRGSQ